LRQWFLFSFRDVRRLVNWVAIVSFYEMPMFLII